jgi:hypothetical protein
LHPTDLGHGTSRAQRGRPLLASGEVGKQIMERVQRLSAVYGTKIVQDGETGVIAL